MRKNRVSAGVPVGKPAWAVAGLASWIFAYAVLLHLMLFGYDLTHPEAFLRADRANERMFVIRSFIEAWPNRNELLQLLATNGIVGDYAFHVLLYAIGGQYTVIIFQVGLSVYSVFILYRFAMLLAASRQVALITALLYLHLPHMLVLPHQLVSEALFIPAMVISTYLLARYTLETKCFRHLALAGLVLGVAALIRPIAIVWPMVVAIGLWVLVGGHRSVRHLSGFVVIVVLPIGLWVSMNYVLSGQATLGESRHDLGHNLYNRVSRIAGSLPTPEANRIRQTYLAATDDRSLGIGTYLRFVLEYPEGYIGQLMRDAGVFVLKSGIERLVIDYFETTEKVRDALQEEGDGWRARLERIGLVGLLKWLIKEHPAILLPSIIGSAIFAAIWLAALYGAYSVMGRWKQLSRPLRFMWLVVLLFPVYVFFVSQVVDAMQSRHRAPAEFTLCLLVAVAIATFWGANRSRMRNDVAASHTHTSKLGAV